MSRLHVPGPVRWTRTEAIVGMASLGLLYWGSVAALASYREDRERAGCLSRASLQAAPRGPHIVPLPSTDWRGRFVQPEPAWAPYPQPQPLGLAYGPERIIRVQLPATPFQR
jgi:hypothetical protein